jgi:hypothetical protein
MYLRELAGGFEKGQIFLTALELDIFTLLETPRDAQELAERVETLPHITGRFSPKRGGGTSRLLTWHPFWSKKHPMLPGI